MAKCALPPHLQDKKHSDWSWPMSYLPRSINAFGPRCPRDSSSYRPWPPKLIEGYGVVRWESTSANSIIRIPSLSAKKIDSTIYGKSFLAIEMNAGNKNYNKTIAVDLKWKELVWPFSEDDCAIYSPSALQEYSEWGYMKLDPYYYSSWKNGILFYRYGYRPDHLDVYYNWGPYLGMKYE